MTYQCSHCNTLADPLTAYKTGPHMRIDCPKCGKFITFLRQSDDPGDMIIYFGKNKGKRIAECDKIYLRWLMQQNIRRYSDAAMQHLAALDDAEYRKYNP